LENQLAKPKFWGSVILSIFLLRTNEFIEIDSNKISMLSYKVINELRKEKPTINMTSKELLRRQVLVSMSPSNLTKFMILSYKHVENINRALKNIKLNIMTDFI